ncbi:C2 family cysteine protease [Methylobacterium sp. JK268]
MTSTLSVARSWISDPFGPGASRNRKDEEDGTAPDAADTRTGADAQPWAAPFSFLAPHRYESGGAHGLGADAATFHAPRIPDAAIARPADFLLRQLEDAGIRADVAKALDASRDPFHLDHVALIHLLQDAAAGGVTAAEFRTLKTLDGLVSKPGGFHTSEYDAYITHALIAGNAANAHWTGGSADAPVPLGDLAAGSTELQADRLIGKWFLGTDHPGLKDSLGATSHYALDADPLFGASGEAGWRDVRQGNVGDCWLVSSLEEIALREPEAIASMFTDNHDGTYGVRFYDWNDTPVYVTVDSQLPYAPPELAGPSPWLTFAGPEDGTADHSKWAPLVEKAFAQLNESGTEFDRDIIEQTKREFGPHAADGIDRHQENSYIAINGGSTELIHYITDKHMSYSYDPENSDLLAALRTGEEVLAAPEKELTENYVSDHMFSVVGYDDESHRVELKNPWGSGPGYEFWTTPEELKLNRTMLCYVSEPAQI